MEQLAALDRKADAAFRRIETTEKAINERVNQLENRLTRLEVSFVSHDRKLDEVAKDVKSLTQAFYKTGLTGGAMGTGGSVILFLLAQQLGLI